MKKRKIYFPPGLIASIIGIILLALYTNEPLPYKTTIKVFLPYDRSQRNSKTLAFTEEVFLKLIRKKKVIEIDIDQRNNFDNPFTFYRKMNFINREIERQQFTHDTTTVFRVVLGDTNTMGDFVWILNQTLLYDIKRYTFFDNSFYLMGNPPTSKLKEIFVL